MNMKRVARGLGLAAFIAVALAAFAACSGGGGKETTVNLTMGDEDNGQKMFYTLDKTTIPAGEVTFVVANKGKFEHELMVYPKQDLSPLLKEVVEAKKAGKSMHVDDDIKGLVKSVAGEEELELEPNKDGRFTVKLTPGTYELACFIVESTPRETFTHYEKGMRSLLTVQ